MPTFSLKLVKTNLIVLSFISVQYNASAAPASTVAQHKRSLSRIQWQNCSGKFAIPAFPCRESWNLRYLWALRNLLRKVEHYFVKSVETARGLSRGVRHLFTPY